MIVSPTSKAPAAAAGETERRELAQIGREIKTAFRNSDAIAVTSALRKLTTARISKSTAQITKEIAGLCYRICEIPLALRTEEGLMSISRFLERVSAERLLILSPEDALSLQSLLLHALENGHAMSNVLDALSYVFKACGASVGGPQVCTRLLALVAEHESLDVKASAMNCLASAVPSSLPDETVKIVRIFLFR